MQTFYYSNHVLFAEGCNLQEIAARFGTPCYVYSKAALLDRWQQFKSALKAHPHQICYAVKANPSLTILHLFAKLGAGFDVVSGGELERVLAAGGQAKQIIFSGVAKTETEIIRALEVGIQCFNVESRNELDRIHNIARRQKITAPVGLRINPDVDAKTHPHITTGFRDNKFGIPWRDIPEILKQLASMPHVRLTGLGCHIGSQITTLAPFLEATDKLLSLVQDISPSLSHIDLGGGLGINYGDNPAPSIAEYGEALCQKLKNIPQTLLIEPGRALVANAGILLTKIEYIKKTPDKNFIITDAGMNDLMRPALYDAWHQITPVSAHQDLSSDIYDIVGPVCESADYLGKNRRLAVRENDLLMIHDTGAYGSSMGSTYNSRPLPPEILVDGTTTHLIRRRETVAEMYRNEKMIN